MNKASKGVAANIWDGYNPRLYLLKLVQFEDEQRYANKDIYEMKLLQEKRAWKIKYTGLVAGIRDMFKAILP